MSKLTSKAFGILQYALLLYAGNIILNTAQKKWRALQLEKADRRRASDKVDLSSEDSFPASDPPAWGGSTAGGPIH